MKTYFTFFDETGAEIMNADSYIDLNVDTFYMLNNEYTIQEKSLVIHSDDNKNVSSAEYHIFLKKKNN